MAERNGNLNGNALALNSLAHNSSPHGGLYDPLVMGRVERMVGDLVANVTSMRQRRWANIDPRRNIEDECGYPAADTFASVDPEIYRQLFHRHAIANRVCTVWPGECFQVSPLVYEVEAGQAATEFEEAWDALPKMLMRGETNHFKEERTSPVWNLLKRAYVASLIGRYGVVLIGLNDGLPLDQPAFGENPVKTESPGQPVSYGNQPVPYGPVSPQFFGGPKPAEQPKPKGKKQKERKVTFLRCFPEYLAQVSQFDADPLSPRYGLPQRYLITLSDPRESPSAAVNLSGVTKEVHWTRVVHLCPNAQSGDVYGAPEMEPVLNRLLDLAKVYGADGEGFWRGAFMGLSLETHPQMGGDVDIDRGAIRDMLEQYMNGLQRYIVNVGMGAKTLAPNVVDPSAHINTNIEAICITLSIPVRIFKGSERGELASSQDDKAWNDRVKAKQEQVVGPSIVAPFINRLINLGVLPEPEQARLEWPDVTSMSANEKADLLTKRTTAYATYVEKGLEAVIPPLDYMTRFDDMTEEEAEAVIEAAEQKQQEEEAAGLAAEASQRDEQAQKMKEAGYTDADVAEQQALGQVTPDEEPGAGGARPPGKGGPPRPAKPKPPAPKPAPAANSGGFEELVGNGWEDLFPELEPVENAISVKPAPSTPQAGGGPGGECRPGQNPKRDGCTLVQDEAGGQRGGAGQQPAGKAGAGPDAPKPTQPAQPGAKKGEQPPDLEGAKRDAVLHPRVTLETGKDGKQWVVKDRAGEGGVAANEAAASSLAKVAGVEAPQAHHVKVGKNKTDVVAVEPVKGTDMSKLTPAQRREALGKMPKEEVERHALFDYALGSSDPNNGNYMVSPEGKLVAIDKERSLGMGAGQKSTFFAPPFLADHPDSKGKAGDFPFSAKEAKGMAEKAELMAAELEKQGRRKDAEGVRKRGKVLAQLAEAKPDGFTAAELDAAGQKFDEQQPKKGFLSRLLGNEGEEMIDNANPEGCNQHTGPHCSRGGHEQIEEGWSKAGGTFGFPSRGEDPAPGGIYYYHGTDPRNLDSMAKYGIKGDELDGAISLAPHLDSAHWWADAATADVGSAALLRVKRKGIRVRNEEDDDYDEENETAETRTYKTISPQSLEVYHNGKWKPLTKPTSNSEVPDDDE